MKAIVVGSTGFIGKNLTRRLISEGFNILCTGRNIRKLGSLLDKVRPVYLDIEDSDSIKRLLQKERPGILFHCAALVENRKPHLLQRINVDGTRNIFQASLETGVEKIVYLSSVAVINGNTQTYLTEDLPYSPTNPYGESKIEAEKIALDYRQKGLRIAILRPCMVYGEGEPHLLSLLVTLVRHRVLPILGDGNNRIPLVDVENVVDAMMLAISKKEACEGTYFLADKEALTAKEILGYMAEVLKVKPPLHIPKNLIPLLRRLPFIGKNFSFILKDRVYSIERLKDRLGYIPRISVYDGLKRAVLACGQ